MSSVRDSDWLLLKSSLHEKEREVREMAFERQSYRQKYEKERHDLCHFRAQLTAMFGITDTHISNTDLLKEVSEYRDSSKFWNHKYHSLNAQIEASAEAMTAITADIGLHIDPNRDQNILLSYARQLAKLYNELKANNSKLNQQIADNNRYCQTLIENRNKLQFEIESLTQEKCALINENNVLKEKLSCNQNQMMAYERSLAKDNIILCLVEQNKELTNAFMESSYCGLDLDVRTDQQLAAMTGGDNCGLTLSLQTDDSLSNATEKSAQTFSQMRNGLSHNEESGKSLQNSSLLSSDYMENSETKTVKKKWHSLKSLQSGGRISKDDSVCRLGTRPNRSVNHTRKQCSHREAVDTQHRIQPKRKAKNMST